ncbi:MAG: LPXTG cell wall anchor domain-containing protein [Chitinophagaceae bacterium]
MRNNFFYNTTVTIVALFFSAIVTAQSKTTVKATVDRSQILIGEPIKLRLEVDVPENEAIRFFQIDSLPHFEFLANPKIDTSNTGSGTVLSQVIPITSFDSGHWVIPSLVLGDSIATDSIPVDVGYSAFNPDQPYHDIKEIIEVTPEEKKEKPRWWYLLAGAVGLLIILILIFRKKKKPVVSVVEQPVDPYKEAMTQLEKLKMDKPEAKQYYSRLVDIFRIYVLNRTGIHSLQDTTDDLVKQLRGLNMHKEQFEQLLQVLRQSDFVKFAKYIPSVDDDKKAYSTINQAIQLIEQIVMNSLKQKDSKN